MDFEKEARENWRRTCARWIVDQWVPNAGTAGTIQCIGAIEKLIAEHSDPEISRAFSAGEESMRERAAKKIESTRQKEIGEEYGKPSEPDRVIIRQHNASANALAARVRSIPLSNDYLPRTEVKA